MFTCPPPSHPGIAVESVTPFPGVTTYAPRWGAPVGYIAAAHGSSYSVLGVHGLHDDLSGMAGYDLIVLDEPMHQGQTVTQTAATLAAAHALNPGAAAGVVEPFAADIDALLETGARPDFVSGETYAGDVSLPELSRWAWLYGVGTQMWATGADSVMAWENRVDLVIAADLAGAWGGASYGAALYSRLGLTCRLALPSVAVTLRAYP